jgi:hypothetical protein
MKFYVVTMMFLITIALFSASFYIALKGMEMWPYFLLAGVLSLIFTSNVGSALSTCMIDFQNEDESK